MRISDWSSDVCSSDLNSYKVSGGLHGVGVSCVNALSEWLRLTISRNGHVHDMEFRRGERVEPLAVKGDTDATGTRVPFLADNQIFATIDYRSEERGVGKECVSKFRSRVWRVHSKKKK